MRSMNNLKSVRAYIKKNWFVFFTIATYLFFTVYYMGAATTITDCGGTLNGLGDNAAGPIWKAANVGDQPIGGFSKVTNYPNGESLNTPIDAVVVGQSLILWTTAKIAGPVCGYNIANVLGYMSAALVMFGFIYSLTKGRRWIALLAGYAVAFTPFFQVKIGGHPSYGFQALLIGVIWAFFSLVATRKKSRAILLAALVALCFYFDPYFSLMAVTILGPLGFVWLLVGYLRSRKEKLKKALFVSQIKVVALSVGLVAVLVAPILYVMATQSAQINSAVAGTRDNILVEARVYSNMPNEYFLPFSDSPIFKILGSYEKQIHDSLYIFSNGNMSEDTVGVSLVMLSVIALFLILISWEKLQHRKLRLGKLIQYDPWLVVVGGLAVGLAAGIMALPPVHVLGIPLPSYILLALTSTWRVLSREYVVVNIAVTLVFSVALVYFSNTLHLKRVAKTVLYLLLFLFIFAQYQTYHPFKGLEYANFSYSNAPKGYSWLKDQSDIKAIAEYPIEKPTEANSHGYYLAMQLVHKKALLNSAIANGPDESLRSSIKNLSDPQTIPVLRSLGIDAVVIHGVDPSEVAKNPYLHVVYSGVHGIDAGVPGSSAITKDILVVAQIAKDAPSTGVSLQYLGNLPRNSSIQLSAIDWQYEIPTNTQIAVRRLPKPAPSNDAKDSDICFMVKMAAPGDLGELTLKDSKGVLSTTSLTDQYIEMRMNVAIDNTMTLVSNNGHNMRMTHIGCQ